MVKYFLQYLNLQFVEYLYHLYHRSIKIQIVNQLNIKINQLITKCVPCWLFKIYSKLTEMNNHGFGQGRQGRFKK